MSTKIEMPSFEQFDDPQDYERACMAVLTMAGFRGFIIDHLPNPMDYGGPAPWIRAINKKLGTKCVFIP